VKILALSDIHGDLSRITQISEVLGKTDVVLLAGDITNFAGAEKIRRILEVLGRYSSRVFGVHGNCDLPAVEEVLEEEGVSLHGRCVTAGGVQFAGIGGTEPSTVLSLNKRGEPGFEKIAEMMISAIKPELPLVLVTHQPPYGTKIDAYSEERHTGSRTIRRFIEKVHPIVSISGHMHEARGQDEITGAIVINPGPFSKGYYAIIEIDGQSAKPEFCCIE
jgi:Icc-related predicted phosphoesterase